MVKPPHKAVLSFWSECRDSNPESSGPKPDMLAVTPHSAMKTSETCIYPTIFKGFCMYTRKEKENIVG
jgi:hypothetical protein